MERCDSGAGRVFLGASGSLGLPKATGIHGATVKLIKFRYYRTYLLQVRWLFESKSLNETTRYSLPRTVCQYLQRIIYGYQMISWTYST